MIAVLLDQGLAPGAAKRLRAKGIDAVHVIELGMEQATDLEILDIARDQERVCINLDHDFHTHLALAGHGRPSVVFLRMEGVGAEAQAGLIESICRQFEASLAQGAAVSAGCKTVRIRRLPLR